MKKFLTLITLISAINFSWNSANTSKDGPKANLTKKKDSIKVSYYADKFHGRTTTSGEIYDKTLLTAAHLKLPFWTVVKITNTANHKSVKVTINDRGPFVKGRTFDLSEKAFKTIGNTRDGVLNATFEIVD